MQHSSNRILTTHTGSLPRPADLAAMLLSGEYASDRAAFQKLTASAVKEAVQKQVDAGVDIVSDGEQSKPSFVHYVKDRLDGFEGEVETFNLVAGDLVDLGMAGIGAA